MQKVRAELRRAGFSRLVLSSWFYMEDQLMITLPRRICSLPLIGKYLVASVNIRAVKENYAPSSLLSCNGDAGNSVDPLVQRWQLDYNALRHVE
jgi:hypothetical protein